MRQPSTFTALYAWHRAALAGENPPRHEGWPECGWFKMREVKNGPWVPVAITCQREIDLETGELTGDEVMACKVNGIEDSAERVWTYLKPISREDFNRLFQMQITNPAMAATREAIDLTEEVMTP